MVPRINRHPSPKLALIKSNRVRSAVTGKPIVAILKGHNVDKLVAEAIELLGGMKQFVKDGQQVTLKPNLVYQPALHSPDKTKQPAQITPAYTTNVRVTEAVIRCLQKAAQCKIFVAEGTPDSATRMFQYLGYTKLAERTGVELVDVDQDPRVTVALPKGLARKSYRLPVVTQTSDVIINLPVLKNHLLAGITVGLKNFFGLLPMPKSKYHRNLSGVLCDLQALCPAALTIVDALYGLEGQGPLNGRPVKMDLIVAGTDVVAVDAVCSAIMGFDPMMVEHLVRASQQGLGEMDLNKITIVGAPIGSVRRSFEHAKWQVACLIKQTEPVVKQLCRLADEKIEQSEEVQLHYGPNQLKVNVAKFPQRKSYGLKAFYTPDGKDIRLEAPYERLIPDNGWAAKEDIVKWIQKNLGKDISIRLVPE